MTKFKFPVGAIIVYTRNKKLKRQVLMHTQTNYIVTSASDGYTRFSKDHLEKAYDIDQRPLAQILKTFLKTKA